MDVYFFEVCLLRVSNGYQSNLLVISCTTCHERMSSLAPILSLSDDEMPTAPGPSPQALRTRPSMKLRPRRGFLRMNAGLKRVCVDPKHLANLIRRKCGCQSDCYASFRSHSTWAEWMKSRKMMANMSKLEKDDYVWGLPLPPSKTSSPYLILGHPIANKDPTLRSSSSYEINLKCPKEVSDIFSCLDTKCATEPGCLCWAWAKAGFEP